MAESTTQTSGAAGSRRRRADAERSIEAILDGALECILADAQVNMAAIARAAGVSRVTLYTHFPTREALLNAALQRAVAHASAILAAQDIEQGPVPAALARLLGSSWQILNRHRNLYAAASATLSPAQLRAYHEPVLGRVEGLIARGQQGGELRTDLPRSWLVATVFTLLHQTAEEINAGRLDADQAPAILTATVLSALTAQPEPLRAPSIRADQ
jgi:AcrR family transcriptional regulator